MRNEHFLALRSRVEDQLSGMQDRRYGWDGHKAMPIRGDAKVFAAWGLWSYLPPDLPAMPHPEVQLDSSGGIVIEFSKDDRHLTIGVPCADVATYHRLWDSGASMEGVIHFRDESFPEPTSAVGAQFTAELIWLANGR